MALKIPRKESISCESDEIRLSSSQQREREIIRYRPANNKKNYVKMRPLDMSGNLIKLSLQLFNLTF